MSSDNIHKNVDFKTSKQEVTFSSPVPTKLLNESPLGLTWDSNNYSCAYDSLFTVFYHLWKEGHTHHKTYFENGTYYLQLLHSKFNLLHSKQTMFEIVQDQIRKILNQDKP